MSMDASRLTIAGRTGYWLKGDWHMHSRHSTDSTNNPEKKIIAFAERHGFDYLAITDHDVHVMGDVTNHTWADPEYRSNAVLLFYGAELTAPRGHVNILSAEPYDHQRVFNARNARDWDLLALKNELGVHFSANHPSTKNHYGFSFDLADSVEIWNTSGLAQERARRPHLGRHAVVRSACSVRRGGSDSHHGIPDAPELTTPQSVEATANYVGTPTTWIFAEERSKDRRFSRRWSRAAPRSAPIPFNPRVELYARTPPKAARKT